MNSEPDLYLRKWEELNRAYKKLEVYYNSYVNDSFDSFQNPKDYAKNFFRVSYELKEVLKNSPSVPNELKGRNGNVEQLVNNNEWIALSMDIANQEKHVSLSSRRSNKTIGKINSHVHLLDPEGNDRTELTIEIDGHPTDCLSLSKRILEAWEVFFKSENLVF